MWRSRLTSGKGANASRAFASSRSAQASSFGEAIPSSESQSDNRRERPHPAGARRGRAGPARGRPGSRRPAFGVSRSSEAPRTAAQRGFGTVAVWRVCSPRWWCIKALFPVEHSLLKILEADYLAEGPSKKSMFREFALVIN